MSHIAYTFLLHLPLAHAQRQVLEFSSVEQKLKNLDTVRTLILLLSRLASRVPRSPKGFPNLACLEQRVRLAHTQSCLWMGRSKRIVCGCDAALAFYPTSRFECCCNGSCLHPLVARYAQQENKHLRATHESTALLKNKIHTLEGQLRRAEEREQELLRERAALEGMMWMNANYASAKRTREQVNCTASEIKSMIDTRFWNAHARQSVIAKHFCNARVIQGISS